MNKKNILNKMEEKRDLFFGQLVIIWARWFIIFAATILALWNSDNQIDLIVGMSGVTLLMMSNFFIHGRYLTEKPINSNLLLLFTLIDLTAVTCSIILFGGKTGIETPYFLFYYPLIMSFGFVFPSRHTTIFTSLTAISYLTAIFIIAPDFIKNSVQLELIVTNIIIMLSMGGLSGYYWTVRRKQRASQIKRFASQHQLLS